MKLAFDIESDGLNEVVINKKGEPVPEGSIVWCMAVIDIDSGQTWAFKSDEIEKGVNLLRTADLIVGHNITMFDIPFLQRLYGPITTPVMDTLIVSRMMYPDRQNHPSVVTLSSAGVSILVYQRFTTMQAGMSLLMI